MKITFKKIGINGEGIGYVDRKPVFCDGVLPGETAEVEIIDQKQNYAKAKLKEILKKSPNRVDVTYPFYIEEGCPLMIMKYDAQLTYKKNLLAESLYKYAHIRSHFIRNMNGSENTIEYRTQCKLPVQESQGPLTTGMYVPGTNHYHPIKYSIIQTRELERIRKQVLGILNSTHVRDYDAKMKRGLRYIVIRTIKGISQCTLVTGHTKIPQEAIERIMGIDGMTGLFQSINTDPKAPNIFGSSTVLLAGKPSMPITLGDITLNLSPESFFQLNIEQAEKLYRTAISKIDPCDTLVEAYCGVGAMSLLAHKKAKNIIGIESIPDAVKNATANAEANGIKNCSFICADAADGLLKTACRHEIDTLLVDPPRSGMDRKMIEAILKVKPRKIIYISCSPSTLAKNLNDLKHQYHPVTIIPYDLFPHTPHVESITVLERDNYQ